MKDVKLVDTLQEHFLEVLRPLSRPAVEHEVELSMGFDNMMSQLLQCKVINRTYWHTESLWGSYCC